MQDNTQENTNEQLDILTDIETFASEASLTDGKEDVGVDALSDALDLDSLFNFVTSDAKDKASEAKDKASEAKDKASDAKDKASDVKDKADPENDKADQPKAEVDDKSKKADDKASEAAKKGGVTLGPTLCCSEDESSEIRSKLSPFKVPTLGGKKSDAATSSLKLKPLSELKKKADHQNELAKHDAKVDAHHVANAEASHDEKAEVKHDEKAEVKHDEKAEVKHDEKAEVKHDEKAEVKVEAQPDVKADKTEDNDVTDKSIDFLPVDILPEADKSEICPSVTREGSVKEEKPKPAEKATPHVLSKNSESIEISAISPVVGAGTNKLHKNSDSIEIGDITPKPAKNSESIEISAVSAVIDPNAKKPWESSVSDRIEVSADLDVEPDFEKTQISLDPVVKDKNTPVEKNVTVIEKGQGPVQSQPMEPIVFEEEEVAPDMSNEPVQPKSVFEKTMSFEMSDNRWDHADKFELPEVGDKVGSYQVTGLLGKGGFGAVYRAKNLTLGREEALKLILPSAKSECEDIEKRFEREIDIVSRLEHPNIVRLYSSGLLEHHVLWMTMELVKGTRLDDRLQQYGAMKFPKAKNLMLQLLSGLMEAHRRQIVHRDLKPANIMLSKKEGYADQVVILDFGLSKALGDTEDESKQNLTCVDSRRVYGTPQYMAPEQLKQGKLGPWTDVYAAGLIFYELLTGQEAVQGMSLFDVAYKQTYEDLEFPPDLEDTAVEAMLRKACAKNPADRYKNAGEFFDALQHIEEISDPPSVLNDNRKNDTNLSNMGMLTKTRDERSEEKTQLGLQAISMDPTEVIRHAEHTGRSRRRADGMKIALFVTITLLVAIIVIGAVAYFLGYLNFKI